MEEESKQRWFLPFVFLFILITFFYLTSNKSLRELPDIYWFYSKKDKEKSIDCRQVS